MTINEIINWTEIFTSKAKIAGITRINYRFEQISGSETELIPSPHTGMDIPGNTTRTGNRMIHREHSTECVRIIGEYEGHQGEAYTEDISDTDDDYISTLIHIIAESAAVSGIRYNDADDNCIQAPVRLECDSGRLPAFVETAEIISAMRSAYSLAGSECDRFSQFNEFMCSEKRKVVDMITGSGIHVHHAVQFSEIAVTAAAEFDGRTQTIRKVHNAAELKEPDIISTALQAAEQASLLAGARTMPAGVYRAIISADVMAELMAAYLDGFSMKYVRQGISAYSGKAGETIASGGLTIREMPDLENGPGNRLYDDETIPVAARIFIDHGVLHHLPGTTADIEDKDHISDAGNGYRETARSGISTGVSNLIMEWDNHKYGYIGSATSVTDIASGISDGVYIIACDGVFAGTDPVSGDFALTSKGFRIINGEIGYSIDQITIAGNFYEMIRQIIDAADDHVTRVMSRGTFITPSLMIDGLVVSGEN